MEIHKPKPFHNVRDFLKEYAIIVLGVATALAGEQAVEKLHNRAKAAEARAGIQGEIADNLARMTLRQAKEACMARRLGEVDGLIADYARGQVPPEIVWIGSPFTFLLHDSKYKAAMATGAVSLFDDSEQAAYADLYALFALYWDSGLKEWQSWDDLRTLEKRPPYSATLDWQLRSTLQHARTQDAFVAGTGQVALREAAAIGIKPAGLKEESPTTVCLPLNTPRAEVEKKAAGQLVP
ncbi:MAG: hypothetical protein JO256_07355 [Alphaproteobacteria bacterium]|nr:hypothetical protein [Alphaproteobacteria bacterium]